MIVMIPITKLLGFDFVIAKRLGGVSRWSWPQSSRHRETSQDRPIRFATIPLKGVHERMPM
jgi:hypothetical protein